VTFESQSGDLSCFGEKASIVLRNITGAPGVDFTYTLLNTSDNSSKQGTIQFAQSLGEFSITDVAPGNYSVLVSQVQTSVAAACTDPVLSESTLLEIKGPSKALDTLYVIKAISLPDLATGSALVGVSPSGSEPYEATMELIEPLLSSQSYFADWTPVNLNNQNLKFERTFTNLFAGTYQLGLRDAAGCEKTFEVKIDVDTNISIPNIFTPNGDGVNDIFYIRNLPADAALIITNRWGKEVFRSGSYQNNWGGGETADGVYYYKLSLPNESITGWVEIVRGN
jgi:gliding motility-associated-like protein